MTNLADSGHCTACLDPATGEYKEHCAPNYVYRATHKILCIRFVTVYVTVTKYNKLLMVMKRIYSMTVRTIV